MSERKKYICWSCGEEREINYCGVCEDCWETLPFLHEGCGGVISVPKRTGKSSFLPRDT